MTELLSRSFEDQLIRGVLFLLLFAAGMVQLFLIGEIQKKLLHLREYLEPVYARHPILRKVFGPPLRRVDLRGYTFFYRIGGVILIIVSVMVLISIFQPPDPCNYDYWSITRSDPC